MHNLCSAVLTAALLMAGQQAALAQGRVIPFDGYLEQLGLKMKAGSRAPARPIAAAAAQSFGRPLASSSSAVPGIRSIPNWGSSFSYNGRTYPYVMVGTNPASGSPSTVPVLLVPIRIVMGDGSVFPASDTLERSINSPLFSDSDYITGRGQFVDAVQRATFWNSMPPNRNWHLRLVPVSPDDDSSLTLRIPDDYGFVLVQQSTGKKFAIIDETFFDFALESIITQKSIPGAFVVGLLHNVVLARMPDLLGTCCVFGFHTYTNVSHDNQGIENVQTWGYASWVDSGFFGNPNIADVAGLSHELAEWANDPFLSNTVPAWFAPTAAQFGCTTLLETGDPIIGSSLPVRLNGFTYHPQTQALLPWFARMIPSNAINHAYSFPDTTALPGLPTLCP